MTLFTITAWCDRVYFTRFDVEAESPEAALEIAKEQAHDEPAEQCDDGCPWDTFRVEDQDENRLLFWQDEGARLQKAAPKLLAACKGILASFHESVKTEKALAEFPALAAVAEAIAEAEGR